MNLNEHFIEQINSLLPGDEARAMLQAIEDNEPVTSVRFNNCKGFLPPASLERVPWCEMGAYLRERPQFTFDPHFHAGSYYVQDASSMFIYHVIKSLVGKPVTYLDRTGVYSLRPLLMAEERDIIHAVKEEKIPVIKSGCPVDGYTKREDMKTLMKKLRMEVDKADDRIFTAIMNNIDML